MNIRNIIFLAVSAISIYSYAADQLSNVKSITTQEQFQKEVIQSTKPVIVKFFATWCNPCTALKPVINKIANIFKDKINFFEINIDNAKFLADQRKVKGVPTVIFFLNGQEKTRFTGTRTQTQIKEIIKQQFNLSEAADKFVS